MNDISESKIEKEKKNLEDIITTEAKEEKQAEEWLDNFLKHPMSAEREKGASSKHKSKVESDND